MSELLTGVCAEILEKVDNDYDAAVSALIDEAWDTVIAADGNFKRDVIEISLAGEIMRLGAVVAFKGVTKRAGYHQANFAGREDDQIMGRGEKHLPISMLKKWGASVAEGYGFELPNGTKLGEASRKELIEAADHFDRLSKMSSQKAQWLRLIAQGLSEGETVRSRLKESRLIELANEAERSAEIPA